MASYLRVTDRCLIFLQTFTKIWVITPIYGLIVQQLLIFFINLIFERPLKLQISFLHKKGIQIL